MESFLQALDFERHRRAKSSRVQDRTGLLSKVKK